MKMALDLRKRENLSFDETFPFIGQTLVSVRKILSHNFSLDSYFQITAYFCKELQKNFMHAVVDHAASHELSKHIELTLDVFQLLAKPFPETLEYTHRTCEMVAIYILLQVSNTKRDASLKSQALENIGRVIHKFVMINDYDSSRENVLLTFAFLPKMHKERHVLSTLYSYFMPQPPFTLQSQLPDDLYVLYLITFFNWMQLELEDPKKQKVILDNAAKFMRPQETLISNPSYSLHIPRCKHLDLATELFLTNLRTVEPLRRSAIQNKSVLDIIDEINVPSLSTNRKDTETILFAQSSVPIECGLSVNSGAMKPEEPVVVCCIDLTNNEDDPSEWLYGLRQKAFEAKEKPKIVQQLNDSEIPLIIISESESEDDEMNKGSQSESEPELFSTLFLDSSVEMDDNSQIDNTQGSRNDVEAPCSNSSTTWMNNEETSNSHELQLNSTFGSKPRTYAGKTAREVRTNDGCSATYSQQEAATASAKGIVHRRHSESCENALLEQNTQVVVPRILNSFSMHEGFLPPKSNNRSVKHHIRPNILKPVENPSMYGKMKKKPMKTVRFNDVPVVHLVSPRKDTDSTNRTKNHVDDIADVFSNYRAPKTGASSTHTRVFSPSWSTLNSRNDAAFFNHVLNLQQRQQEQRETEKLSEVKTPKKLRANKTARRTIYTRSYKKADDERAAINPVTADYSSLVVKPFTIRVKRLKLDSRNNPSVHKIACQSEVPHVTAEEKQAVGNQAAISAEQQNNVLQNEENESIQASKINYLNSENSPAMNLEQLVKETNSSTMSLLSFEITPAVPPVHLLNGESRDVPTPTCEQFSEKTSNCTLETAMQVSDAEVTSTQGTSEDILEKHLQIKPTSQLLKRTNSDCFSLLNINNCEQKSHKVSMGSEVIELEHKMQACNAKQRIKNRRASFNVNTLAYSKKLITNCVELNDSTRRRSICTNLTDHNLNWICQNVNTISDNSTSSAGHASAAASASSGKKHCSNLQVCSEVNNESIKNIKMNNGTQTNVNKRSKSPLSTLLQNGQDDSKPMKRSRYKQNL